VAPSNKTALNKTRIEVAAIGANGAVISTWEVRTKVPEDPIGKKSLSSVPMEVRARVLAALPSGLSLGGPSSVSGPPNSESPKVKTLTLE
jgi:hypothetical protein